MGDELEIEILDCCSCDEQVYGANAADGAKEGWYRRNIPGGGVFTLCPKCRTFWKTVWEARTAEKVAS